MNTRLVLLLILIAVVLTTWYEVRVWQECTQDHPWWYCLRLLSQ